MAYDCDIVLQEKEYGGSISPGKEFNNSSMTIVVATLPVAQVHPELGIKHLVLLFQRLSYRLKNLRQPLLWPSAHMYRMPWAGRCFHACCSVSRIFLVLPDPRILYRGHGPTTLRFEYYPSSSFDFTMQEGILRGKQVKIINQAPFWAELAKYMGAECLRTDDFPTRSTYVVAAMDDYHPSTLEAIERARSLRLDVFTLEWLVQMVLHGTFIDPTQPAHVRFIRRDPILKVSYERSPDVPNSRDIVPLGKPLDSGSIVAVRFDVKRYELGDYVILRQSGVGFNEVAGMAMFDERRVRYARIREIFPIPDTTVFRLVVDLLARRDDSPFHLKTTCEKLELPLDTIVSKITCVYVPEEQGGKATCEKLGKIKFWPLTREEVDFRDRLYFLSYEPV